jgi:adenine-specific DNA-methyltransferase
VDTGLGERLSLKELEEIDGLDYRDDPEKLFERRPTARLFALHPLKSGGYRKNQSHPLQFWGRTFPIGDMQCWKHTVVAEGDRTPGMRKLFRADRLYPLKNDVRFIRFAPSPPALRISNWWDGLGGASSPIYVVQSSEELAKRCILMTTDPGDLVLDPTCGSGTTATVAEQWGRRWITIDTSRVALALARTRLMSARYAYYLLKDSPEGVAKEQALTGKIQSDAKTHGDIRQGFVYQRTTWNTSGSIANDDNVDVIWERWQEVLEPIRAELNERIANSEWRVEKGVALDPIRYSPLAIRETLLAEWEIPRAAVDGWPEAARKLHAAWWEAASPAKRKSTPRSPVRRMSNISMTAPTRTRRGCALPGRSPSKACRRTGW